MKYILKTEINSSGNKVFSKVKRGKDIIYFAKDECGAAAPVNKNWILANQKCIVNLGVSGTNIYPVEIKKVNDNVSLKVNPIEHNVIQYAKRVNWSSSKTLSQLIKPAEIKDGVDETPTDKLYVYLIDTFINKEKIKRGIDKKENYGISQFSNADNENLTKEMYNAVTSMDYMGDRFNGWLLDNTVETADYEGQERPTKQSVFNMIKDRIDFYLSPDCQIIDSVYAETLGYYTELEYDISGLVEAVIKDGYKHLKLDTDKITRKICKEDIDLDEYVEMAIERYEAQNI